MGHPSIPVFIMLAVFAVSALSFLVPGGDVSKDVTDWNTIQEKSTEMFDAFENMLKGIPAAAAKEDGTIGDKISAKLAPYLTHLAETKDNLLAKITGQSLTDEEFITAYFEIIAKFIEFLVEIEPDFGLLTEETQISIGADIAEQTINIGITASDIYLLLGPHSS